MAESIANPILNSPYDPPERHFEVGPHGPTGEIKVGRRPSESFIPIAAARKGKKVAGGGTQQTIDFDLTGERREKKLADQRAAPGRRPVASAQLPRHDPHHPQAPRALGRPPTRGSSPVLPA